MRYQFFEPGQIKYSARQPGPNFKVILAGESPRDRYKALPDQHGLPAKQTGGG
jgi:hypothetical protein